MVPETRYARSGDVHIAYQVSGEGPMDVVVVPMIVSHLDLLWDDPHYRSFFERMGSFCRVIRFDKRGMGMSDRMGDVRPSLDERMDDIRAVMDDAGSERAALFGLSEGGALSLLFAATHPERVLSVALFGATGKWLQSSDYPIGMAPEIFDAGMEAAKEAWGTGVFVNLFAPSIASDPEAIRRFARLERSAVSPGGFIETMRVNAHLDVRYVLDTVDAPTLLMVKRDEVIPGAWHSRYLAERLPHARIIEFEGMDHVPWTEHPDEVLRELQSFLTGRTDPLDADRMLATVMFTDIVDSTRKATDLGDRRWRDLLDTHDSVLGEQVATCRGRLVKSTGDGALVTFDAPRRAIDCAGLLRERLRTIGLDIRVGLHAGEVEVRGRDVGGIAVHIAARVAGLAAPGEILVSRTIRDLLGGSEVRFVDRGTHVLKGIPDPWELLAVSGA